ncbi:MAG: hypothetical protein KC482_15460 [Dehalococcoidia bacterium]|nr:hypothetical protein [Dehalococcoidia bacterium]MCA9825775.1 hypothetical protein [Dehalococcoidia bacterium]MCA9843107.1 hypothetical protein [Dehalococcoidia bacterium]MCA9854956.1 hypothetical protein [Dehalococcoidia bacterium]
MTQILKWLGGAGLAVMLFGIAGTLGASQAAADSPPAPPATFVGAVLVDGVAPSAGTVVEARIGGASCGVTTVFNSGSQARYTLEIPALDPDQTPNCGTEGASVDFWVGGKKASQTGSWLNYQLNQLDLTVVTPPTPTAPETGTGASDAASTSSWLFAVLGLGVIAFGASGVAVARRTR